MPAAIEVTIPVPVPIVATAGDELDQTPPGVVLDSVVPDPLHIARVPEIGATAVGALTVTTVVAAPVPHALVTL